MSDRNILFDSLQGKITSRPAWVPFVGVHGAELIGKNADDYLKSADLLVDGLSRAVELYDPDGLPIVFDVQMEAETLGCELNWSVDGPPSVLTHPLEMGVSLADLPEFSTAAGRFPVAGEALRRLKKKYGEKIAWYGLVTGPFTLALHLAGNMIFLNMYDNAEKVDELIKYCAEIAGKTAEFYIENGADVIALVDPMTSQISPEHFEEFATPHINAVFDRIRELGAFSSLFVCGDATRNIEVMCQTRCDNISVDENIDLEVLAKEARKNNKSVGGNLQLTTVLLLGNKTQAAADAVRCLDTCGNEGFILAPGCDLPWGVPVENLQAVSEVVRDPYKAEIYRNAIEAEKDDFADITLPDYSSGDEVIVDVITLDSSSCAPCQYMFAAAKQAAGKNPKIKVFERKIKNREGLGFMKHLGANAIPTICINGKPTFSSIIPDNKTLAKALADSKRK